MNEIHVFMLSLETEGLGTAPLMLREPTTALFALLADIHQAAFAVMDEDGWSASSIEDLYNHEGVCFYVAMTGDDIQAFAIVRTVGDEAELLTLASNPAAQKRGLALAVMKHVFADMKRGRVVRLFLEVRADNEPAANLYKKVGFQNMGLRKNYYKTNTGKRIDACTLARTFGAA